MIFLNQIKDTRYVVQINFLDDLIFKINVNPVLESKPEYSEYMDFLNYQ